MPTTVTGYHSSVAKLCDLKHFTDRTSHSRNRLANQTLERFEDEWKSHPNRCDYLPQDGASISWDILTSNEKCETFSRCVGTVAKPVEMCAAVRSESGRNPHPLAFVARFRNCLGRITTPRQETIYIRFSLEPKIRSHT